MVLMDLLLVVGVKYFSVLVSVSTPMSSHLSSYQVQEQIVAKLAARLEDKQDSGAVILLLHSLGNTGSRAAVRVLLQYLKEEDLDM